MGSPRGGTLKGIKHYCPRLVTFFKKIKWLDCFQILTQDMKENIWNSLGGKIIK